MSIIASQIKTHFMDPSVYPIRETPQYSHFMVNWHFVKFGCIIYSLQML